MTNEYVYVTGQDGEVYEVRPTDALLNFLRRLAEDESEELESLKERQPLPYSEILCS